MAKCVGKCKYGRNVLVCVCVCVWKNWLKKSRNRAEKKFVGFSNVVNSAKCASMLFDHFFLVCIKVGHYLFDLFWPLHPTYKLQTNTLATYPAIAWVCL